MTQPLKIIFAGTPDFAAHHLQAVLDSRHEVIAVYTQPDRPAGRGRKLTPSPVKALALEHNLPVYQPISLRKEDAQQELEALDADLMVVVAYGLLLSQVVLDTPKYGCINVHASILPRWRGAAPIQRAIAAGDAVSGVTIMQMDIGLDTGEMLFKAECPVTESDTGQSLHNRLQDIGGPCLQQALDAIAEKASSGTRLEGEKQCDSNACYAHKMSKEEGRVNWEGKAFEVDCLIRAFNPWPVAWTELNGDRIRVWEAEVVSLNSQLKEKPGTILSAGKEGVDIACGQGVLRLKNLQLPGSRAMTVADLLNSRSEMFQPGNRFD